VTRQEDPPGQQIIRIIMIIFRLQIKDTAERWQKKSLYKSDNQDERKYFIKLWRKK
jgi:hypothetical protein